MATQVAFIERSTAEADRARTFLVDRVEVEPPFHHTRERDDGTVERTETRPETIVLVGIGANDMRALEGTKWTHFAFDRSGHRLEGPISAIEVIGDDRVSFALIRD